MGHARVRTATEPAMKLPSGRRLERDPSYGFLRVVPPPSDEELAAYYADRYRLTHPPHDCPGRLRLITRLHPRPGRVLDIGCGEGELLECFLSEGWAVTGVEPGRTAAEVARNKGIRVIDRMMSEELSGELGTFDVVVLAHVLEHLPRPEEMIAWVHRLLRPGGVLYCEVPNDFNPLQLAAVQAHDVRPWWIALPDHLNYFSIETLAAVLDGHGFEVALRTTDFPLEMFILQGDVYVDDPATGRAVHEKRCRFEEAMRATGHGDCLDRLYEKLAELNIGRQAIVCATKR